MYNEIKFKLPTERREAIAFLFLWSVLGGISFLGFLTLLPYALSLQLGACIFILPYGLIIWLQIAVRRHVRTLWKIVFPNLFR
jgi:4-amino-4-deoxy-L-arabinose transferase-like glycosyltransferase